MVLIDFCCLLQKLTNASAIITGVIQTLLVRIPWAHTFALAKLDSMEMEKSALVTITALICFPDIASFWAGFIFRVLYFVVKLVLCLNFNFFCFIHIFILCYPLKQTHG